MKRNVEAEKRLNLWMRLIWLKVRTVAFEYGNDIPCSDERIYLSCYKGLLQGFACYRCFMTKGKYSVHTTRTSVHQRFCTRLLCFYTCFYSCFYVLWWTAVL